MSTRDIDTDDTGLPIPGHEHDPPRSQALEEPAPLTNQPLTAKGDLVERLLPVYLRAARAPFSDETKELPGPRTGLRAVISELAAMGGEALGISAGRHEVETGVYHGDYNQERETAWACNLCGYLSGVESEPCDRPRCATRVLPILAAKDATLYEYGGPFDCPGCSACVPLDGKVAP